mmetsp:Transcript_29251/g.67349  ORF Transcript_29251/g.67349 Transcript_29251/m.67349 type:complete len:257 (-) Transcript_29251:22-792(-)
MGSVIASSSTSSHTSRQRDSLATCVEEILPDSEQWLEVSRLLQARSPDKHIRHYHSVLKMRKLYRIIPQQALVDLEEEAVKANLGKPSQLFHGTSYGSAAAIAKEGFQLPQRAGMFGRGIYFAKDPLKSVQYARSVGAQPNNGFNIGSLFSFFFGPAIAQTTPAAQRMLLCDVYLGKSMTKRRANRTLTVDNLRRHSCLRRCGARDYNSVHVPGGRCGAVAVTEYVVYHRYQAIPRFLLEFETGPPGQVTATLEDA